MWGFRELILDDSSLDTAYITVEADLTVDGVPYHHEGGRQDELHIDLV